MTSYIERLVCIVLIANVGIELRQPSHHVSLVAMNVDLVLLISLSSVMKRVAIDGEDVGAIRIILVIEKIPMDTIITTENIPLASCICKYIIINAIAMELNGTR